jgi:hypothetical protein
MRLSDKLKAVGYQGGEEEFKDVVKELHGVMHPAWSVDRLLVNPPHETRYCAAVRARTCEGIPDEDILGALLNCRKKGEVE